MYYVMIEHPQEGKRSWFEFVDWFEKKKDALAFREELMSADILGGHIKILEPTKL